MKTDIDKAIEILQDYVKLDREIREGDTESDYGRFCEEKCEAIESLMDCINTNRNYIGFEMDNTYYELANKRIKEHNSNEI